MLKKHNIFTVLVALLSIILSGCTGISNAEPVKQENLAGKVVPADVNIGKVVPPVENLSGKIVPQDASSKPAAQEDKIVPPQPVEQPKLEYSIIIIKDENVLQETIKGANGKEVKEYLVCDGKDSTPTPEGKFIIVCKFINPAWIDPESGKVINGGTKENPLGLRWLGLKNLNNPGDNGRKLGIHGNNNEASIGKSLSHGCVRMHNKDVIELYEKVPIGTHVEIVATRPGKG